MGISYRRGFELMSSGVSWLRAEFADRCSKTLLLLVDQLLEGGTLAVKAHLLATPDSPPDALPLVAAERQIERAPAETDTQHRERLLDGWDIWELAGTPSWAAIELAPLGVGKANVLTKYQAAADWDGDTNAENFSRWWVVLKDHPVWGAPAAEWGDFVFGEALPWTKKTFGAFSFGDDEPTGETTWGSSASVIEVAAVRRFLHKRKAGHEVGVFVILDFGDEIFGAINWGSTTFGGTVDASYWPIGQFWGEKYVFTVFGDVHPIYAGQPAVFGTLLH